jgi:hypothetical protein
MMTKAKHSSMATPVSNKAAGKPDRLPGRWTAASEKLFLAELAVSANVRQALRVVGLSSTGLYQRRRTNPAFRAAWDAQLTDGYARLEAMMLARAIQANITATTGEDDPELRPVSDATALTLLSAHARHVAQFRATETMVSGDVATLRRDIRRRLDRLALVLDPVASA